MEWYRRVHFVAAVPMPEDIAEAYGTTINGMWAAPESRTIEMVEEAHAKGNRVLFSVPLIALTPQVYAREEWRYLLDEVCSDIEGNPSMVPWYYWESEPVYSMCIYSPVFRRYLLDRCRDGIDRGMDVVSLDEINSSVGLMDRRAGGSGFCAHCLNRFKMHLLQDGTRHDTARAGNDAALATADDDVMRQRLRDDDGFFDRYRRFHELEAFGVIVRFIKELRAYAQLRNPQFAITGNVAFLGNLVGEKGDLWGPMWVEHLDFVMMENIYQPHPAGPHLLPPRGKFTAWYRLGSSFSSRSPPWICPSIMVPKQLAGQQRVGYYLLMFVEAYANGGRWGYYWWPGVDVETRLQATAPEQLKEYIRFIDKHRDYFEDLSTRHRLAILYLNSGMRRRPNSHFKYVALAQALAEAGYQYDVIYGGDGIYSPDDLDMQRLAQYHAALVPEAENLTDTQLHRLSLFSREIGHELILFTEKKPDSRLIQGAAKNEELLFSYWRNYREEDREQITALLKHYDSERIHTSNPLVNVIRFMKGDQQILHFINYNYDSERDHIAAVEKLDVRVFWEHLTLPELRWLTLDGERLLPCRIVKKRELAFEIPRLELYGMAILR